MFKSIFIYFLKLWLVFQILNVTVALAQQTRISNRIPWIKPVTTRIVETSFETAHEIAMGMECDSRINTECGSILSNNILSIQCDKLSKQCDEVLFKKAFRKLKNGQYQLAIIEYELILTDYPESKYLGDSYYWLAEATYLSGNHKDAIDKYRYILENYPDNKNVINAEFKIGQAYYQMKMWPEARNAYLDVIANHSNLIITDLAQNKLRMMERAGYY